MQPRPGIFDADYKVAGGKLLRVRVRVAEAGVIDAITIFGDFFMHPEAAIEVLEGALAGAPLDAAVLRARVQAFFDGDVQVIGAGVDDFVHVILKAVGDAA